MDKKEWKRLVHMADRVEISQLMAKMVQYFDQFDARKIYDKLLAKDHPEVSVEFMECGKFIGPEKVKEYMEGIQKYLDDPSDKRGWMGLQNLSNPHIIISASGNRAMGQWEMLNANALPAVEYPGNEEKLTALWVCGRYNNEFVKVDGKWKILKIQLVTYFKTPFDQGWIKQPDAYRPAGKAGVMPSEPGVQRSVYHPDALYSGEFLHSYGPYLPDEINDGPEAEYTEDEATMERIERAAAVKEIEMIQGRYLTLLDSFSMAKMADELFAMDDPECCFTMCEGGDYVGIKMKEFIESCNKPGIGNPMAVKGWFGMVELWSPNVVVSKDGLRARAAFNELAPHAMAVTPYPGTRKKPAGYWFIARYDNEYVKKNGEWKLLKNRVYSYARSPYELGWIRQADARRILHGYHAKGGNPIQPQYLSANRYSGKGANTWGPFLPDEDEF